MLAIEVAGASVRVMHPGGGVNTVVNDLSGRGPVVGAGVNVEAPGNAVRVELTENGVKLCN